MKLNKNTTYLVKLEHTNSRTFWLVQQDSQRGWSAVRFSEVKDDYEIPTLVQGNSKELPEKLLALGINLSYREIFYTKQLRENMFTILKTGEFL